MGDLYKHHLVMPASLIFLKILQFAVQRLGLSGFLAHSFVVSSSEEEERLFRHSCSVYYLVGRTSAGSCLISKHGHDASVVKPIKFSFGKIEM